MHLETEGFFIFSKYHMEKKLPYIFIIFKKLILILTYQIDKKKLKIII